MQETDAGLSAVLGSAAGVAARPRVDNDDGHTGNATFLRDPGTGEEVSAKALHNELMLFYHREFTEILAQRQRQLQSSTRQAFQKISEGLTEFCSDL